MFRHTDTGGLRVAFFGMGDRFMGVPLRRLAERHLVVGVVLPTKAYRKVNRRLGRTASAVRLLRAVGRRGSTLSSFLRRKGIPILEFDRGNPQGVVSQLAGLEPDLCCVAGFPCLLDQDILAIPRHGFLNIHPSLLPAYRGPNPYFWVYHEQEAVSGVTVHFLDGGEDTGPVVSQEAIPIPHGLRGLELVARTTELGARLLADAVDTVARGSVSTRVDSRTSPTVRASRPDPQIEYVEWAKWKQDRVFHFLRGVMPHWYTPPALKGTIPGSWAPLRSLPADDDADILTARKTRGRTRVRCLDGWIEFGPVPRVSTWWRMLVQRHSRRSAADSGGRPPYRT